MSPLAQSILIIRGVCVIGYTHYWTQKKNYSHVGWAALCQDIKAILDLAQVDGITLWAEYDEPNTHPELNKDFIRFNGAGDDGHETFYISRVRKPVEAWQSKRDLGWAFCKTSAKPYDIAVVACLAYLGGVQGFKVDSDGDADDWADGIELACLALPRHRDLIARPMALRPAAVSA